MRFRFPRIAEDCKGRLQVFAVESGSGLEPTSSCPLFDRYEEQKRTCLPLELNDATAGCMCDGVGASDRIQLVDQSTHMELGGVDRYAKTASYCLV